jgi:L-lactate dehydrogenase complex protein LldF
MLVHLRERVVDAGRSRALPSPERIAMAAAAWTMSKPSRWRRLLRLGKWGRLVARRRILPPPVSTWAAARDVPMPPTQTFRDWWKERG